MIKFITSILNVEVYVKISIKDLEDKIRELKRIKVIAKEKAVFKRYDISKLDREILFNFEKVPAKDLAKKLKCNRSYIYATIEKFKNVYTKVEVTKW